MLDNILVQSFRLPPFFVCNSCFCLCCCSENREACPVHRGYLDGGVFKQPEAAKDDPSFTPLQELQIIHIGRQRKYIWHINTEGGTLQDPIVELLRLVTRVLIITSSSCAQKVRTDLCT